MFFLTFNIAKQLDNFTAEYSATGTVISNNALRS